MRQYIPAMRWLQLLLDLAVVQACLYALTVIRLGKFSPQYLSLALISTLLMIVVYQWQRVYHGFRAQSFWSEVQALLRAWGVVLLALVVLGFGSRSESLYSRPVLFSWAVLGALAQLVVHMGTDTMIRALRARGINQRRTILVGDERLARQFGERLRRDRELGIKVLGVVDTRPERTANPEADALPYLGSVENLAGIIQSVGADLVCITLPHDQLSRIEELIDTLIPLYVDIHWAPDLSTQELFNHRVYELGGQPVLCLTDAPIVGLRRAVKWLEDMVLATIILIGSSPLMLAIAIAVKLTSPGPVLFKQRRIGYNGEEFTTYKFRSMVLHEEPPGLVTQALREDPRVTSVGRFLRRTSLDELPQLINVLQGRMSIVGPRPHAAEHDGYYAEHLRLYMLRHRVKPGITGWAQVNGWRGETDTPDKMRMRVKYDLYYINNWSFLFDLLIVAMTLWQMVTGRNAW